MNSFTEFALNDRMICHKTARFRLNTVFTRHSCTGRYCWGAY